MEHMLRVVENGQAFTLEAEYDGTFWFVKIYAHDNGEKRRRFTYKINHPKDEEAACQRGWELFKERHLNGTSS
ncbi:TPA: hypothetical protein DCE37_11470 [Candidatus Latescibacteria bacterium]|nr:hypothetical protein [Candidatus Latescibacterota bacterium]